MKPMSKIVINIKKIRQSVMKLGKNILGKTIIEAGYEPEVINWEGSFWIKFKDKSILYIGNKPVLRIKKKRRKCPECGKEMEFHPKTCYGYFGNVTEGPHYFCSSCNIEMFPDGEWRRGK